MIIQVFFCVYSLSFGMPGTKQLSHPKWPTDAVDARGLPLDGEKDGALLEELLQLPGIRISTFSASPHLEQPSLETDEDSTLTLSRFNPSLRVLVKAEKGLLSAGLGWDTKRSWVELVWGWYRCGLR